MTTAPRTSQDLHQLARSAGAPGASHLGTRETVSRCRKARTQGHVCSPNFPSFRSLASQFKNDCHVEWRSPRRPESKHPRLSFRNFSALAFPKFSRVRVGGHSGSTRFQHAESRVQSAKVHLLMEPPVCRDTISPSGVTSTPEPKPPKYGGGESRHNSVPIPESGDNRISETVHPSGKLSD